MNLYNIKSRGMRQLYKKRRKLIQLYGAICFYCGKELVESGKKEIAATVDHKLPYSKGGTHDLSNLALACNKCNKQKADNYPHELQKPPNPHRRRTSEVRQINL